MKDEAQNTSNPEYHIPSTEHIRILGFEVLMMVTMKSTDRQKLTSASHLLLLLSCLAYSLTLKMEEVCSSRMFCFTKLHGIKFQKTVLFH
jgi:hypothetical protein